MTELISPEEFSPSIYADAVLLQTQDPARLTDVHLKHLAAAFDDAAADEARAARDRAITAKASNGKDENEKWADTIYTAVEMATSPLHDRISALERRQPQAPAADDESLVGFARGLAEDTREYVTAAIAKALAPVLEEVTDLRSKALVFEGVWSASRPYCPNSLVVRRGVPWVAKRATHADPHTPGCVDWALLVEKGK